MAIVRKAVAQDFEKVYPLFVKFNNPRLSKDDWRQLFVNHWHTREGYFGYVLEDGERIVGFLGLIFGRRILNEREEKFCNLTSWVVDEKFRSQSLFLLLPVLKLKDYTLTILTGSQETYAVARKLGFQDLESHVQIILPLPSVATWLTPCQIEINGKQLGDALAGEALQAYKDHLAFRCFHVHVRSPLGECYLIGTRVFRKDLAFAQIHHISDSKVFVKFAGRIAVAICLRIKTVAIATDQRFLGENTIPLSLAWPLPNCRVYKSSSLGKNDIDLLYSEYPVLNI
tara:strand:- start:1353 stop:2207 length:855 start_codon:yes stop_codon:yes gene_type:complete